MPARTVVNEHVTADRRLPRQHVPGRQAQLATVPNVDLRRSARRQDDDVRLKRHDVGIFHVRVGMELYAQALQLAEPPLDNAHQVPAPGTGRTDEDLAAEGGGGLIDCDGVSPLGADPRGFEAGRPAAHDNNLAYRTGAFRDDRGQGGSRPVAGLCRQDGRFGRLAMGRADTGPDLGLSPGGDLCDEMRVGDLSPRHADHVDLAFRQGETRGRDVGDARGMEHRQPDLASERADRPRPRARAENPSPACSRPQALGSCPSCRRWH